MRKFKTLALTAVVLSGSGGAAAIVAGTSNAEPKIAPLAQLRAELPALTTGAPIAPDSSALRATPIAPEGDPVVDTNTLRRARGIAGPAAVVAATRDGNGACVGSANVLACAPRSALHELGGAFGLSFSPDGAPVLAALLLKPNGTLTVVYPDGTRTPLQAVDGVISTELPSEPAALEFTAPNGVVQSISTLAPQGASTPVQ